MVQHCHDQPTDEPTNQPTNLFAHERRAGGRKLEDDGDERELVKVRVVGVDLQHDGARQFIQPARVDQRLRHFERRAGVQTQRQVVAATVVRRVPGAVLVTSPAALSAKTINMSVCGAAFWNKMS